jgi:chaperonin GroEL (HSP60 family)
MQARHTKGELWAGVNGLEGVISDMAKLDVYEPLAVKVQALKSATESSTMLLKIDDIIAAAKMSAPPGPPGGGMGGMGGMPPGMGGMPPM